jgi:hypothetical protein
MMTTVRMEATKKTSRKSPHQRRLPQQQPQRLLLKQLPRRSRKLSRTMILRKSSRLRRNHLKMKKTETLRVKRKRRPLEKRRPRKRLPKKTQRSAEEMGNLKRRLVL